MKFWRVFACLLVGVLAVLLAGQAWDQLTSLERKKNAMTPPSFTFSLGMGADEFDLALGQDRRVNKQPAGLNFHKKDWLSQSPGLIRFLHGSHSFDMDAVLGVTGTEDVERPTDGIKKVSVYRGLSAEDLLPHDEARLKTTEFLRQLLKMGWQQYYYPSEARVKGKSSWLRRGDRDPRYTPTLEEWMQDGGHFWKLEVNGVYLRIHVQRSWETPDPLKPGAYLMTLNLETELNKVRLWFPEDKRNDWQAHWPAMVIADQQERGPKEAQARARGLELDTDYKDARILALEGPLITAKVDEPCPKAGWWEASLPQGHVDAKALAKAPSRWRLLQAGEPMPSFGRGLMPSAESYNAAVVWTWRKAAQ